MNAIAKTTFVGMASLGMACTVFIPKETLYLEPAQDRATQDDVRQKMGTPHQVAPTKDGDPIWVYQVLFQDSSSQNKWGAPGTWCDEYVLYFDKHADLLRDQRLQAAGVTAATPRESCFIGEAFC